MTKWYKDPFIWLVIVALGPLALGMWVLAILSLLDAIFGTHFMY